MMAFKRKETVIEAVDLNTLAPEDVERRVIAGVKRYATHESNYSKADANTPFLGHIVGMGIESSNLADITLSVERQFLTKKTKRVPLAEGSAEFRLEPGDLGALRILDGEDAMAATPGLTVKMLMDLGHMPANAQYSEKVVSFGHVMVMGEGYRLNESLQKLLARVEKLDPAGRQESQANLQALVTQARNFTQLLTDEAGLAQSRRATYERDKAAHKAVEDELANVRARIHGAGADAERLAALKAEEAQVKSRLKQTALRRRLAESSLKSLESAKPVERNKLQQLVSQINQTVDKAAAVAA